jgi:hypothetical protein
MLVKEKADLAQGVLLPQRAVKTKKEKEVKLLSPSSRILLASAFGSELSNRSCRLQCWLDIRRLAFVFFAAPRSPFLLYQLCRTSNVGGS